jgi:hypothetical protein
MIKKQPNAVPGDIVIVSFNQCSNTHETKQCRGKYAVVDCYSAVKNNVQSMIVKFISKNVQCEIESNKIVNNCELSDTEITVVNNCEHLIVKDENDGFRFICNSKDKELFGIVGIVQCIGKRCYWKRKPPVSSDQMLLDKYSNPKSNYIR